MHNIFPIKLLRTGLMANKKDDKSLVLTCDVTNFKTKE